MREKSYHHGNLHTELIEEGLALIHEKGWENFSLRKLAKRLEVTPTACYNHYSTAEELLTEMKSYVTKKFCVALLEDVDESQMSYAAIRMGISYVKFFAKNPHYFSFIYDNDDYKIDLSNTTFDGDFKPFHIFKEIAIKSMEYNCVDKDKHHNNLIVMWSTVHGLAAMANMQGFHYNGDWGVLTEELLLTKLNLL